MKKYTIGGLEVPEKDFFRSVDDNYMKALIDHTTMVNLSTIKNQIQSGIPVIINNITYKKEEL
jgi:hypothetical protein